MKKALLLGVLVALGSIAFGQEPARYGIKSGYVKTVTDTGGQISTLELWFDEYGARQRTVQTMSMGDFGEYKTDILSKDGQTYLIDEERKSVKTMEGRPEINFLDMTPDFMAYYKMENLGTEVMLGYECTKWKYQMRQLGRTHKITTWVWEGICIKTIIEHRGSDSVSEVVELIPDADIPESTFMVPYL